MYMIQLPSSLTSHVAARSANAQTMNAQPALLLILTCGECLVVHLEIQCCKHVVTICILVITQLFMLCCVHAARGCRFSLYGCTVKPSVTLVITPDAPGAPAPVGIVIGEALVIEILPNVASVLNMCFFRPDRMEYAVMLQHLTLHATFTIRDGVVRDIQPDSIDLLGDGVIMPPPLAARPILPVAPRLHVIPMDVPAGPAAPQANMVWPNVADASSGESDDDFTDSE